MSIRVFEESYNAFSNRRQLDTGMDDTATPVSTMYGSSFDLPSATTAGRVYGLERRVEEGGTPVTPTRQGQQTSATPSRLPRIEGRAAIRLRGDRTEPVARQLEG